MTAAEFDFYIWSEYRRKKMEPCNTLEFYRINDVKMLRELIYETMIELQKKQTSTQPLSIKEGERLLFCQDLYASLRKYHG
jgi:hypothetical protein